jgi:hypothetical protein
VVEENKRRGPLKGKLALLVKVDATDELVELKNARKSTIALRCIRPLPTPQSLPYGAGLYR